LVSWVPPVTLNFRLVYEFNNVTSLYWWRKIVRSYSSS